MKNDTYEVNKKNITVTSIGSLLVFKKFFKSKFFDVLLTFNLLCLLSLNQCGPKPYDRNIFDGIKYRLLV